MCNRGSHFPPAYEIHGRESEIHGRESEIPPPDIPNRTKNRSIKNRTVFGTIRTPLIFRIAPKTARFLIERFLVRFGHGPKATSVIELFEEKR